MAEPETSGLSRTVSPQVATRAEIHTLHRYFIWQTTMRQHYFDRLVEGAPPGPKGNPDIVAFMYMSYWYAALYVVVEGWGELGLEDAEIDGLLESPNVALLRRYRNGVFHFQRAYYDDRFIELIRDGESVAEWVRALSSAFGRYFLQQFEKEKAAEGRGA
jgi:hypothetical protein